MNAFKVLPLADDFVTIYESPDPQKVYAYTPGLLTCPNGRLVATCDLGGPGVEELPGSKRSDAGWPGMPVWAWQGKVFISDDHGLSWRHVADFPFFHARPFIAGDTLYVLGHYGDLMVIRSDDWGESWTEPVKLTEGQDWHQSACNVHYANGCVYLVMERRISRDIAAWSVGELAPVLMRGRIGDDLTRRESWTFASEIAMRKIIPDYETDPAVDFFGVPFFTAPFPTGCDADGVKGRDCAPMGWLETNVVQIFDPNHYWFDPSGRTFHLWMRAHTGGTGYAALAKVVEHGVTPGTGPMEIMLETVPSGKKIRFGPCPGGQMRFHVLCYEPTKLYWLLSTQATDSMTRADRLPPKRFNLPNNERRRLQLHFSKNMIDWCFAGLVAEGPADNASRHYASMAVDGDDLVILSRSGDERASCAHNGNLITFHRINDFRGLVY